MPAYEEDVLKRAAVNILNCEFNKLPTELLVSPFLKTFAKYQKKIFKYTRLVSVKSITEMLLKH